MSALRLSFTLIFLTAFCYSAAAEVHIIPRPEKIIQGDSIFELNAKTIIIANKASQHEALYLSEILGKAFGHRTIIKSHGKGIELLVNEELKNILGEEGYKLTIHSERVIIEGATNAGVFYGIQSFRQLLPADFEFYSNRQKKISVLQVMITDKPRFTWRSFMLDESRHFKGMEEVKNLLDQMALLKMNVFHWHLTDDQGWRIEIKKYPMLTSIGGFRKDSQAERHSDKRVGIPHGGFYTQEQIKEIVRYASERHIRIVPEIEMPGHAMAAIAAYPWLGTLGTTKEVPVTFGKMDDSFNISDPRVFNFLKDVLTEVFTLFPDNVVHIGGDEVKFDAWKNSSGMQGMMSRNGLSSPIELQVFFTNRFSHFIDSTGHRMMGWNEILGDNVHEWQVNNDIRLKESLAKSAVVHFWKGNLDLINKAVSNGYDVVNSYHAQTYLDYDYATISLLKAYTFDPVPEGLDPAYTSKILGSGCQMWSEWTPTVQKMEYQVFPRLAAYAEVGWTAKSEKDYNLFLQSLSELEKRWDLLGINYCKN
jgi:hexosaminidase